LRYPPEKIDEIRSAVDIVDLVGSYVKLKKRGKKFVGLCPFHAEKTPSFNVSPERQMYHCFGCGVGGNAITFVMEYEKVSFPEAVRTLAERAGISLPQSYGADAAGVSEAETLYEACSMAGRFFYHSLTETTEGQLALEYFHHRGFSDETIKKFGLGYAPNGWDALIKHAERTGVSIETLEKAGLVRKREDATYYDYFRGRAMFPIFSSSGRVVGFGARKLREDDPLGKYINSPETPIYNKSRILYGIHHAKDSIREKDSAVLVEGYADLITVYQAGVHNVVASSGTALTPEQVQLLARYTKNIIIVYDADSAGSKAALRGIDLVLENDLEVRVAQLPAGEDPDSFVKRQGVDAFNNILERSISFVDFIARAYEQQGKFSTPQGQAEAVRTIVQTIAKMKDELKRHFYIKHVAERYKLYESTLYGELEKYLPRAHKASTARAIPVLETEIRPEDVVIHRPNPLPVEERDVLHAMLEGREDILSFVFQNISADDFTDADARMLASRIKDSWDVEGKVDSSRLMNELEDEASRRLVAELLFSKYEISKGWQESGVDVLPADTMEIARDALTAFRRRALALRIDENQRRIREAGERSEDVTSLLDQRRQLLEEMKSLDSGIVQAS
jgi:DNA primase